MPLSTVDKAVAIMGSQQQFQARQGPTRVHQAPCNQDRAGDLAAARVWVLCGGKEYRWHLAQAHLLQHWGGGTAQAEMGLLMEESEEFSEFPGQGQYGLVSLPVPWQYSSKWWAPSSIWNVVYMNFHITSPGWRKFAIPIPKLGSICHEQVIQIDDRVVQSNCSYNQFPLFFCLYFHLDTFSECEKIK